MRKREKALEILERLSKVIEAPETELDYGSVFELLVAVILSAQCTDKRVNMTTPALFARYPSPKAFAEADMEELISYISSISFPGSKARYLIETARILMEKHKGEVPRDYDALLELPGVGRKTANVVTSVVWNEPRFAVDTHVFRVADRLGLTEDAKNPLQAERQLTEIFPAKTIPDAHHYLILHGRYTCVARNPKCHECVLPDICPWYKANRQGKVPADAAKASKADKPSKASKASKAGRKG